jgi:hypothetical protein
MPLCPSTSATSGERSLRIIERLLRPVIPRSIFVLAVLVLSVVTVGGQAQSPGRLVQCHVEGSGKVEMSGTCRFTSEKDGSFALENVDRDKPLFGEISIVSVSIVSPGVAEVRGLTVRGNNSRWGEARRSPGDRACWQGSDFRICAR